MKDATVLMMSYYREDTRTLLCVAEELRRSKGLTPLFLIASTGALRDDAAAVVRAAGFAVFDELPHEDVAAGHEMRNPFRRARVVRDANIRLSHRILERTGAAAIVCTMDAARGHFVEASRGAGIPSLYVQWAEMDSPELLRVWWRAEARYSDLPHRPLMRLRRRLRRKVNEAAGFGQRWPFFIPVSRLAVAGPFYRDICIRAGIPPERVEVTGNAQCDAMYHCAGLTAGEIAGIKRSMGVDESRKILLYALNDTKRLVHLDQGSAAEAEAITLAAMRAASPESVRVVKLHPKQDEEDRARIRALDPEAVVIGQEVEIGPLVAASAAVVATVSSGLLWAVGIDRPSISAYFWRGAAEMKATRWWTGVERADTFEALVASLRDNLQNPEHIANWSSRRRECRDRFLRLDGRSISRIVEILCSLLSVEGATQRTPASLAGVAQPKFGTRPESKDSGR